MLNNIPIMDCSLSFHASAALVSLAEGALCELELIPFLNRAVVIIGETLKADAVHLYEFIAGDCFKKALKATYSLQPSCPVMSLAITGPNGSALYGHVEISRMTAISNDEIAFLSLAVKLIGSSLKRYEREQNLHHTILEHYTAKRDRDNFMAAMAHELRNPLNAILGFLNISKELDRNSPEFADSLAAIERSARTEAKLVSDLFEASRGLTGKLKMDTEIFSLKDVLKQTIGPMVTFASQRNIRLECKIDEDAIDVLGDQDRLQQVIWNLVGNAIKFSPDGGRVEVCIHRVKQNAVLSVKDNGIGLRSQNLKQIFNPFWQCEGKSAKSRQGLGLGLFIVQQIIESHKGTIEAHSEGEGKGATFIAKLPLATRTLNLPIVRTQSLPTAGRLSNLKVIAIDDSPDSLELLSRILQNWGIEVAAFDCATQGLQAAMSGDFDMVISDINMPELDGFCLMRQLRSWESGTGHARMPAIALTGRGSAEDNGDFRKAGFDYHVAKPLNFNVLHANVMACAKAKASSERNLQ